MKKTSWVTMKKLTTLFTLAALISTANLSADEVGGASSAGAKTSSHWQHGAIAGGAIVATAISVIAVAVNNSSNSNVH